jgi:toxin ParE1/3/4
MPRLVFSPQAQRNMERLTEFLLEGGDVRAARETLPTLLRGLAILKEHPLIGPKVEEGLRELVISRGKTGYVALYDYDAARNMVIVQAVRHQREGGYGDGNR